MIPHKLDIVSGVLTLRPQAPLQAGDFAELSNEVDAFVHQYGKLYGLMIVTSKFPGWQDLGAFFSHANFIRRHHHDIARVALVTDSILADMAEFLAAYFINARVRHYPYSDEAKAASWVEGGE